MSKLLVSEGERRWIAEKAFKEMGSKVTYKVLDLDKVVERIRNERKNSNLSPYIEIQPISEDQYKNPLKMATYQKDPLTGVLYGIALSSDEFGNIRWQKIQLSDMLSINLDNENDARIWAVIRFNPNILGSPFQSSNPYYKIYDPVDEAIAEQAEILAMEKAFERVKMLLKEPQRMVQFARFLGHELRDNTNYEIVHGTLLRSARHNPAFFNSRWESRSRSYAEIFYSARALGIITEEANSGFGYKNIVLGISEEEAISFLSKDRNVLDSISSTVVERDKALEGVSKSYPAANIAKPKPKKEGEVEENDFN